MISIAARRDQSHDLNSDRCWYISDSKDVTISIHCTKKTFNKSLGGHGPRAPWLRHCVSTMLFNIYHYNVFPLQLKPGVHTNDFAPIHRLRALKLGHASLATVFRPGRLTLQPILRENLESPVLRYQPITTAVVTDACLNTRWHHGAYTSAVLIESLGLDRVVTVYAELSRPDWLATVQSGRKQVQSRVCTPSFTGSGQFPAHRPCPRTTRP